MKLELIFISNEIELEKMYAYQLKVLSTIGAT